METDRTVAQLLPELRSHLKGFTDTSALDAEVLLADIMERPRSWILAHPEGELTPDQAQTLEQSVRRLQSGEPLPYVLGHWEFFGLDLELSPAVLIPRPETELLVETALTWLRAHPGKRQAADVGTGSGCLAIALASHVPDLHVAATDISPEALSVAERNVRKYNLEDRVYRIEADLLPPSGGPFDLIAANLPYIPTSTLVSLPVYSREPHVALDGGPDGLDQIARLLQTAPGRLAPGGILLMEIEASQGQSAAGLARRAFPNGAVKILPDLAGLDRLVTVESSE